jgi:hypothetical protein
MREADWVSAHLFYTDDLDVLLVDAVRPLVTDLLADETAHGYFFLRHWDGGPHVRLRLLVPDEADQSRVRGAVLDHCGQYLRRHPSVTPLSPERYATMAARLAGLEQTPSHRPAPLPNNAVQFIAYRREYDRFGTDAEMQAVERHFIESSHIAMALIGSQARADQLRTAAYAMIVLAWLTGDRIGLAPATWTGLQTADLEAQYLRQRDRLLTLADLAHRLAAGRAPEVAEGSLAAWLRSIRALRAQLPESTASRVIDICAHLLSNRLGLTLPDEGCLRHFAARAMTELDRQEATR